MEKKPDGFSMQEIIHGEFIEFPEDLMSVTRENIALLNMVKNCGVIEGEGITSKYVPLMNNQYIKNLEDNIIQLSDGLTQQNLKLLRNEFATKVPQKSNRRTK